MYSSGYVEGLLTCVRISQYYANVHSLLMSAESSHHALLQIRSQLEAQVGFMRANGTVETEAAEDAKWEQRMRRSRCSALVRVKENNADLYVGHTTWADYSTMTRIYKYYHLPLPGAESMVTLLSMSSYPGTIHSGDTYIMADSGLVITETQLELIDFFKYDNVKDFPFNAHLPNWVHLLITTRLASTGAEWAKIWSTQNTGTLMSQWLIVDYNLYKVGKPLPDNLLWIVEQVPGQIESRDMTQYLRSNGYWGSVNRPFFTSVRDVSGFTKAQASHGALYSVN